MIGVINQIASNLTANEDDKADGSHHAATRENHLKR